MYCAEGEKNLLRWKSTPLRPFSSVAATSMMLGDVVYLLAEDGQIHDMRLAISDT